MGNAFYKCYAGVRLHEDLRQSIVADIVEGLWDHLAYAERFLERSGFGIENSTVATA